MVIPRVAFQLWCLGDPLGKYPPLRNLQPVDLGDDSVQAQKNKRRRLADLRSLMIQFEEVRALPASLATTHCVLGHQSEEAMA